MHRRPPFPTSGFSRRSAVGKAGAVVAALGLGGRAGRAVAMEGAPSALASHPIVGVWQVSTPSGVTLAVFSADGTNIQGIQATQPEPQGVSFISTQVGRWEPVSERGVHFTGVQLHSDANGAFTGSVTIDGYPVVIEAGQTFVDDQSRVMVTIRDATGAVVQQIPGAGGPPVTGIRMGVGAPGFPVGTPAAGTPTG